MPLGVRPGNGGEDSCPDSAGKFKPALMRRDDFIRQGQAQADPVSLVSPFLY
jgi:hypothetical protein